MCTCSDCCLLCSERADCMIDVGGGGLPSSIIVMICLHVMIASTLPLVGVILCVSSCLKSTWTWIPCCHVHCTTPLHPLSSMPFTRHPQHHCSMPLPRHPQGIEPRIKTLVNAHALMSLCFVACCVQILPATPTLNTVSHKGNAEALKQWNGFGTRQDRLLAG
jgi:hypothetical protein